MAAGATTLGATTLASADVTGTLGVTGATTLTGATQVNNTLTVGAFATTLGGTLSVAENATFTKDVSAVNGTFSGNVGAVNGTFSGDVTATDKLIGANLEIGTLGAEEVLADNNGIKVTNGTTLMGMGVNGKNNLVGMNVATAAAGVIQNATYTNPTLFTTADGGTTMNFTADKDGNVVAAGTLDVTGATTLAGLTAGATTLASATVTGATQIGQLTVTDNEAEFAGIKVGTLDVTGNTTIAGTLSVAGATSLTSATVTGTLGVGGKANLADAEIGNLKVTDYEAEFAGVKVGTLVATGAANLQAGAIVGGNLNVTGTTAIAGLTTIGTTLSPANLVVNGDLTVTGTINGAIGSVNGTIQHSVGTAADPATFATAFADNSIVTYTGTDALTLPTTLPAGTQRTIVNSTGSGITVDGKGVDPGKAITVVYVGTTWIQL